MHEPSQNVQCVVVMPSTEDLSADSPLIKDHSRPADQSVILPTHHSPVSCKACSIGAFAVSPSML